MSGAITPLAVAQPANVEAPRVGGLSIDEMKTIARAIAGSSYFAGIEKAEQAFVKILYGAELQIGPMAAIAGVHIVEGKPSLDASLIAARIKQSGRYDYRIRRSDEKGCEIEFFERGESLGLSTFLEVDAERAKLLQKNTWQKYPRDMYRSRAMTRGARMYCPDVFNGAVYTPEELNAPDAPEPIAEISVAPAVQPAPIENAIAGATTQSEPESDTQVEPEQTQALASSSEGKPADAQGDDAAITAWIETWFAKYQVPSDDVDLLELTGQVSSDGGVTVTYDWRQLRIEEKRELVRRFSKKRGYATRG
jgi:hypothetical protein